MEPILINPAVNGNIGSCTSQSIEIESGRSFFILDKTTVVTNACTGVVEKYNSWDLAPLPFCGVLASIFLMIAIAFAIIDSKLYN